MMLARIIGVMLRCVKKKENFFVTFYSSLLDFVFHKFLLEKFRMLHCSIIPFITRATI